MPSSIYVYALLLVMAVAAGYAYINEARDHAADSATHKANLQTTQDNLKAAHDANDELVRQRENAERALAVAQTARIAAQAKHDARARAEDELERQVPAVRAYLDELMPCDLYRELRARGSGANAGDCEEGAAPGRVHPAVDPAGIAGPAHARPEERLARDRAAAGQLQQ